MGQYGNQPDFGTIVTTLSTVGLDKFFPPSAIYVGSTSGGELCSLTVLPAGNQAEEFVTITGISAGTFLPIVITKVISSGNVDAANVLLYR